MRQRKLMDSLDESIIKLLCKNARTSSETLAEHLGVSSTTVRRRIDRLVTSGIMRTVAVVDPTKVGVPLAVVIALNVAQDKLEKLVEKLAEFPQVTWLSTMTGRSDIMVFGRFRSTDDLSDFIQKDLASIEGIKNAETSVCLHVKKGRYIQQGQDLGAVR